jgi:hypothetical protein
VSAENMQRRTGNVEEYATAIYACGPGARANYFFSLPLDVSISLIARLSVA